MEYSINKFAKLAGVSTRTLRYYDEIGLLMPHRVSTNGYRIYGRAEVDHLQQILFYRELGIPLEEIRTILGAENYEALSSLQSHLDALLDRREQINRLIQNVENTISSVEGERTMKDIEKFEGFKKELVSENEKKYGKEIREKYGDETIDESNQKLMGLTEEKYKEVQDLSERINTLLKQAVEEGDPAGEAAQKACELHKAWLMTFWKKYTREAHRGLATMYVEDPRFSKYYEDIAPGGAAFLRDAIEIFCGSDV